MAHANALGVGLRTAHVAAMSLLVGGSFAAPGPHFRTWQLLTVATGLVLLAREWSHSRHWPYQVRGLATFAHVAVLATIAASPALAPWSRLAALVIGSVGSHMPRVVRKWSLVHRRVLD